MQRWAMMGGSLGQRVFGDRDVRLRRRMAHYNDPSFGPRTRTARRRVIATGLLLAVGLTFLTVALTTLLQGYLNLGLSLPATIGIWWLWLDRVRVSSRGLTELPPEVLDERQRSARARAYERAHRLLVGGFILWLGLAFVDRFVGLDATVFFLVGLFGLLAALGAPGIVLALSEPDETADQAEADA
jgi:hypothetical protein